MPWTKSAPTTDLTGKTIRVAGVAGMSAWGKDSYSGKMIKIPAGLTGRCDRQSAAGAFIRFEAAGNSLDRWRQLQEGLPEGHPRKGTREAVFVDMTNGPNLEYEST